MRTTARPTCLSLILLVALGACGDPTDRAAGPDPAPDPLAPVFDAPPPGAAASAGGAPGIWRQPGLFHVLDEPRVAPAGRSGLRDGDPVLGVRAGAAARAYPLRVLHYHHAANDEVGSVPVLATACELCSSAVAYVRRVGEVTLTFEFEGAFEGTLLLRDRQTGSLWLHLTGQCVSGPLAGAVLPFVASRTTTWGEWRSSHPDTDVVLPEPAFADRYAHPDERTAGQDFIPRSVASTLGTPDPRLAGNDLVFGVAVGASRTAYPVPLLSRRRVVDGEEEGVPTTVWQDPSSGAMVGYVRRVGDRVLTFEAGPEGIRDRETSSRWNLDGEAVEGPLRGRRLQPLHAVRAEWYGWTAHHPGTRLAQ